MLDQAKRRTAERGLGNVELLLADAQTHDFAPASFDLVVSRFGVMFFADPFAAFRNLHGALRDGGRLAMAVWAPIADNTHWKLAYDIVVRRLGPPAAVAPQAPGPLAFSDPDYFRRILAEAGFADIRIAPREFHVRGESAGRHGRTRDDDGPVGAGCSTKSRRMRRREPRPRPKSPRPLPPTPILPARSACPAPFGSPPH